MKLQVTKKRLDNCKVLARADPKAAGATREALVSAAGDRAVRPSVVGVVNDGLANLKVGEPMVIYSGWDDQREANISACLTAQ